MWNLTAVRDSLGFYMTVAGVVLFLATPLSVVLLDEHFVTWLIDFIGQSWTRVSISYWSVVTKHTGHRKNLYDCFL